MKLGWSMEGSYAVDLGDLRSLIEANGSVLHNRRLLLVTTPTVDRLYRKGVEVLLGAVARSVDVLVLPCREISKTAEMAHRICQACADAGIDRRGVIVALGGGVCSDLSTFAASMFKRGIDTVRIPTTLIGQIDAAIGLKGGANFHGAKNAIGCFHAPKAVLVDPMFLRTLQGPHLSQGLAEILKIALIRDVELFDVLDRSAPRLLQSRFQDPQDVARFVLRRAILGMLEELEGNPFETKTYKRLVDMGHTISPILEAQSGFELHHGFAVAIDMAFTCALSVALGQMQEEQAQRFLRVIADCKLPLSDPRLTPEAVRHGFRAAVTHRGGSLNLPIPVDIGGCTFIEELDELPSRVVEDAFAWLHAYVHSDFACVAAPVEVQPSPRQNEWAGHALSKDCRAPADETSPTAGAQRSEGERLSLQ